MQRIIHTEAPQAKNQQQCKASQTNYPGVHNHSRHKDRSWDFSSLSSLQSRQENKNRNCCC